MSKWLNTADSANSVFSPTFTAGTRTWLKLVALVLMVVDHVDWLLFDSALGLHDTVGRIVFPIFGWLLAYNLAQIPATAYRVHERILTRLVIFGVLAFAPYVILRDAVFPLNIMFTLAAFVGVVTLINRGLWFLAAFVCLIAHFVVDYQWPGLLLMLGVWAGYQYRIAPVLLALPGLVGLYLVNGSHAAMLALPVLMVASTLDLKAPRWQALFYVAYPVHLVVLAVIAAFMDLPA